MGSSSNLFLDEREKEVLINTTFYLKKGDVVWIEEELRKIYNVVDFKIIQDTKELYEKDDNFKKLVKLEKEARKKKELYINKHL